MKHREYRRIVPGAENAVLFIHGICGTPNHFVECIPMVSWVPEGYSVQNILLPGHGGRAADFGASSLQAWRCHVRRAFCRLAKTHRRVYIAAHSMGTLFALELAVEFPGKIPGMVLLGVPLRPHLSPGAVNGSARLMLGRLRPGHRETAIAAACGIETTLRLWEYIPWLPRYAELFAQIARTEKILPGLTVPTWVFQSKRDELVSNATWPVLEKYPVKRELLENSGHFYYDKEETERVRDCFFKLLSENVQSNDSVILIDREEIKDF